MRGGRRRLGSGWIGRAGRGGVSMAAGLAALFGVACSQGEQGEQGEKPAAGSETKAPAAAPAPSAPSAPATPAETPSPPAAGEAAAPAGAGGVAKGKQVYAINCTACHNADPTKDGALGPAIAGSSLALVEARVVRGEYPPGYTPKRPTKQMVPLPHLASAVPDLAAYLESVK